MNKSNSMPSRCCAPPPPPEHGHLSLRRIIDIYKDNPACCCHTDYENLAGTLDFVCGKHNEQKLPDDGLRYLKHPHQRCFSNRQINQLTEVLEKVPLDQLGDFDRIHEKVMAANPVGFNFLGYYDFCLRYCFNKRIFPQRYVYIHRGALAGAGHLRDAGLLKFSNKEHRIPLEAFPQEIIDGLYNFEDMGTFHIENFLCVMEAHLSHLKTTK